MAEDIKCPYCSSKDLSTVPGPDVEKGKSVSITYKCQMCHRSFSKTTNEAE